MTDDGLLEARAEAIARSQCFLSPLFIWRSIWEEFIPRKPSNLSKPPDRERINVEDRFGITTGNHGVVQLIALWYVSERIYQGKYPQFRFIREAIAHRIGSRRVAGRVLRTIVSTPEDIKKTLGWFVTKTGQDLNVDKGGDGRVQYIACSNSTVVSNVFSIVNTAINVGNITRSEEFVLEVKKDLLGVLKRKHADREVLEYLNSPQGNSLTMKLSNLIRENLRNTNFNDEQVEDMKVERLRKKDDPKPMFWNYEALKSNTSARMRKDGDSHIDMIDIPEPEIGQLLRDSVQASMKEP